MNGSEIVHGLLMPDRRWVFPQQQVSQFLLICCSSVCCVLGLKSRTFHTGKGDQTSLQLVVFRFQRACAPALW